MASEIRVNQIQNRSGLTTVTWNDEGLNVVGVATAFNFKTGTTNVHSTGIELANVNTGGATATFGGPLVGSTGSFSSNVTISGNLGVAGTVTYEDVARVDATGISTFREGFGVGPLAGIALTAYKDGSIRTSGIITASTFGSDTNSTFTTAGSERLRIDSSGRVLIGTTTEGAGTYAETLTIAGTTHCGMTLRSATNGVGSIYFSDGTSGDSEYRGYFEYNHTSDFFKIATAAAERVRIGSAGQIGLSGANYGSSGQVLTSAGSGSAVSWTTISGGVTSDAQNNTVGGENAGNALDADTLGNTLFGENAGLAIDSGDYNHCFGYESGKSLTSGNYNIAMGFESLKTATSGGGNIAIGHKAMNGGNITGANNIAIGYEAGKSFPGNINGNVAIGYRALYQQNGDRYNTAIGYEAGMNIQGAHDIVAVGHKALKNLTSGAYNTAIGWQALESLQTGQRNTAVGRGCLDNCVSGSDNTCMGIDAGMATTAGSNVMIGTNAGRTNTTGDANVYIGTYVADQGTDGSRNVAIGMYAMSSGVGSYNTLIGWGTGHQINGSGGRNNTCLGYGAGYGITDGHTNICIGNEAGYSQIASDDYKLFIARGNVGPGSGSCWVYGDGAGNVIRAGNGTSWSQTSDRRIKKNIVDNSVGLDVINKIRIRNFEYRTEDEIDRTEFGGAPDDKKYTAEEASEHDGMSEGDYYRNYGIDKSGVQLGVIAQELEEVLPNMVNTDSKTTKKTTNTDELIWHLVNAVKELSVENASMKARISTLESA